MINRAPAKVQSALLVAMQKQITIASETFKLDRPFIVLATQNLLNKIRTYPSEVQQDDFNESKIEYPTKQRKIC